MTSIKWQTPPESDGRGRPSQFDYDAIVTELKNHPGHWALVAENTSPGLSAQFKKRGCEVTTRTTGKRENGTRAGDIYARWPEGDQS